MQDFASLTFVNDSPPLYIYDKVSKDLIAKKATDHSLGRVIAGTANGDLCIFVQPRVIARDLQKHPARW